ncbi:hypothetical protein HDU93_003708, partial [Gonapodya sp. JEL0774]
MKGTQVSNASDVVKGADDLGVGVPTDSKAATGGPKSDGKDMTDTLPSTTSVVGKDGEPKDKAQLSDVVKRGDDVIGVGVSTEAKVATGGPKSDGKDVTDTRSSIASVVSSDGDVVKRASGLDNNMSSVVKVDMSAPQQSTLPNGDNASVSQSDAAKNAPSAAGTSSITRVSQVPSVMTLPPSESNRNNMDSSKSSIASSTPSDAVTDAGLMTVNSDSRFEASSATGSTSGSINESVEQGSQNASSISMETGAIR